MSIVLVGNEKGGCGKTTLSVNLAAIAAGRGVDVLLVDADPGQQSAAKWAARRADTHPDAPGIRCVSLTSARNIQTSLPDLARRYGLVIVDTGAENSPELRATALLASVWVLPVQPDGLDLWTLPTMEGVYAAVQPLNEGLRAEVVVNRIPYQAAAQAGPEVRDWMAEHVPGFGITSVQSLIGRAAYGRATGEGLGVAELRRGDVRAAAEMQAVYEGVLP